MAFGSMFPAADRVQSQRWLNIMNGRPDRMVGGPLPDPRWDAFFGSLQNARDDAFAAGDKFRADLTGGLGDGIGFFKMRDPQTDLTVDPARALGGLRRAMRM